VASVRLVVRPDDEPATALMFVTAAVDGADEDFLLDTGGSRSRVRRSARTDAWAVDAGDSGSRGVFGAAGLARRARVPSLTLGPIQARDVTMDVSDGDADGPAAILGLDVLRGHRLGVRAAAGVLELDQQAAVDRWRPLAQSSRGHPFVTVEWDGASAAAVWDTGASITVVDTAFAAAHPQLFAPTGTAGAGIDAHGRTGQTSQVRMAPCEIGGRRFSGSAAATAPIGGLARPGDPAFSIILGYPVIVQADWAVDLSLRMWGFLDRV